MLLLDDQEDLVQQLAVGREVLPRHVRHTRRQKLDEENYEKFQCDIDDTRDDSSRYVVCGTTKKISVKKWVHRLTDEKFSRGHTTRATTQKFDEKNRCDMVEGVGQKEAKGAGFWGQGTTQSRRRNAPHRLKLGGFW